MSQPETTTTTSRLRSTALWAVIVTLIGAGLIGAFFVIFGDQANVAGRVWLTLFLLAAFAGAVALDGTMPDGPNRWYLTASTLLNVFLLAMGLLKLWNGPLQPYNTADEFVWAAQFSRWLGVVSITRVALLVTQFWAHRFVARAARRATRLTSRATVVLVWLTGLVFVVPLSFPNLEPIGLLGYADWWWRIAGATALVMAVTVIIPVVVRAFEPRAPRQAGLPGPQTHLYPQQSQPLAPPAPPVS